MGKFYLAYLWWPLNIPILSIPFKILEGEGGISPSDHTGMCAIFEWFWRENSGIGLHFLQKNSGIRVYFLLKVWECQGFG